jgi:hypothetical protein
VTSAAEASIRALDVLLSECVDVVCAAWVSSWRKALQKEGRAMQGGWPGTKAEARARILQFVGAELTRKHLPFPTPEQLDKASAEVYAAARRAWLAEAAAGDGD